MKGFKFSLERIHNYKGQVLNEEKNNLSLLHKQRRELLEKIEEYKEFIAKTNAEMKERQAKGITILELSTYNFTIEHTRKQIYQTTNEVAELDVRIAKQTNVVLEASREVKGLDKLYEHQKGDYDKQTLKTEEDVISEHISVSHYRAKSMI